MVAQPLALVNSDHGMAVANINRYEHETPRIVLTYLS
jgi:hypothetical protein